MSRFGILAGFVMAAVLVYQFNVGKISTLDVVVFLAENSRNVEQDVKTGEKSRDERELINKFSDKKNVNKKSARKPKIKEDRNINVLAFGDIMLGRYVRVLMDENGLNYIFEELEASKDVLLKNRDVVFGNLEGPIKGAGKKGGTSMVFSFNEDVAQLLKDFGFTILSISNNHALDQGWDGRDSTVKALENVGLGWCGHPSEADSSSVYYSQIGEEKYAFVCFQDITHKLDYAAAVELIRSIKSNVDYLIVSVHWGIEYKNKPDFELQIEPAHEFIDAGADFIIGHHPHVVQSFEVYNGRMIFYSLGNFVFDQYWSKGTQEELAIGIILDDADLDESFSTKVELYPMKSEKSQSRLMNEVERSDWIRRFIGYGSYDEKMKEQIRQGLIEVN